MKSTLLVSFSLALFSSSLALGATITVPDDYATIQAAIDAAAEGDTIQVRAGEYQEVIDFGVKNLTLESIDGADSTFIGVAVTANLYREYCRRARLVHSVPWLYCSVRLQGNSSATEPFDSPWRRVVHVELKPND